MNDEGAAHYEDIIENFVSGHQFIYKKFKVLPTVGWQIDPFGHTET